MMPLRPNRTCADGVTRIRITGGCLAVMAFLNCFGHTVGVSPEFGLKRTLLRRRLRWPPDRGVELGIRTVVGRHRPVWAEANSVRIKPGWTTDVDPESL